MTLDVNRPPPVESNTLAPSVLLTMPSRSPSASRSSTTSDGENPAAIHGGSGNAGAQTSPPSGGASGPPPSPGTSGGTPPSSGGASGSAPASGIVPASEGCPG